MTIQPSVVGSREYFAALGLWPPIPRIAKPDSWLSNFREGELRHAVALLESFIFFNADMTTKLFVSAFHALSSQVTHGATYEDRKLEWSQFLKTALVTHPTGERPSVTDSGYMFDRLVRQEVGIHESQILDPNAVLNRLLATPGSEIVFVDDFAGTGHQFLKTWSREYVLADGTAASFSSMHTKGMIGDVYYIPCISTMKAKADLEGTIGGLRVLPAHSLPEAYSAVSPDTILVPSDLIATTHDFIVETSARAGISETEAFGYGGLGLAIGFEHAIPNATLPFFWVDSPSWKPLMRRR